LLFSKAKHFCSKILNLSIVKKMLIRHYRTGYNSTVYTVYSLNQKSWENKKMRTGIICLHAIYHSHMRQQIYIFNLVIR
jgi:hypothetical protein